MERLPDCSILDALCKNHLHTPIDQYLVLLQEHAQSDCAECAAIAKADQLMELEAEAPCTCRTSGDLFDPTGCEFHDRNSPWNVRMRALSTIEQYEREVA
jgi:hypothetical protein